MKERDFYRYIKNLLKENFKFIVAIEFIMDLFTFNIIIEVALLIVCSLILVIYSFLENRNGFKKSKKNFRFYHKYNGGNYFI